MKKLNLGCGNVPLIGYINVDKYYYPGSDHPGMNIEDGKTWNTEHPDSPWVKGDMVNLHEIPNDSVDEVIAVHSLEHLSMEDGVRAIREMIRVVKKGGRVEIEVPDLTKACKLFLEAHISKDKNNGDWFRIMGLLYGSQGAEGEGQFHLCGYSKEALKYRMEFHGLINIEEIPVGLGHGTRENLGHGEPEFDFRLKGIKEKLV